MIQAIGLTSEPRGERPPAVHDLTFDARPGNVTVLLGPAASGKTTALRLMLQLQSGRGVALFRGRPLHRVPNPPREIGVVLGDVPGDPSRTAIGHLRLLSAAAGVPVAHADDVLDLVGLTGLADKRVGDLSRGMDRRLALAAALLGDPHTLVLDEPTDGLQPRDSAWLHGLLRGYAAQGGAVLITSRHSREATRIADRVITLDDGLLAADQDAVAFARTRMRPRVVVRSPQADRLATLLIDASQRADHASDPVIGRGIEVVRESGSRIAVYGSNCAAVGETAFRNRVLVHQLADEAGDSGLVEPLHRADGRQTRAVTAPPGEVDVSDHDTVTSPAHAVAPPGIDMPTSRVGDMATHPDGDCRPATTPRPTVDPSELTDTLTLPVITAPAPTAVPRPARPPRSASAPELHIPRLPAPGPAWPLRYEVRRTVTDRTVALVAVVSLLASLVPALLLARHGAAPLSRVLSGWPRQLPFPPAALGAGLVGSLAFGQEFRFPALAHERGAVPRRLGLLVAKLVVSGVCALALGVAVLLADEAAVRLLFGADGLGGLPDIPVFVVGWAGLLVGCAWAGVLAAGLFRSTAMGLAAVLAVPVLVVPALRYVLAEQAGRSLAGLAARLQASGPVRWPSGIDHGASVVVRWVTQPVGGALALSVAALVCAYGLTALRSRVR
ncbi:ATP-binding cassette domain-containing protein [Streptomyces sp. NBC_01525]|uniref:ATP-binding cassette domain-containing protein n=1 Tax=Streptomyces sp. NBC_01525 TaxID=2903893 RepID=UPI0038658C9F